MSARLGRAHAEAEAGVVVFCGGLSAALFAAKAGARVILCEKSGQLGGTTATSGGVMWIPGSAQARVAGIVDPPDEARRYLMGEAGNHARADLIDAFLDSAAEALATLEAGTHMRFVLSTSPDYHPDRPGGVDIGRSLVAVPFDAAVLGGDFDLVRAPMKRLMVLGGMMVGPDDLPAFVSPFRSVLNLRRVMRRVARYAVTGCDLQAGRRSATAMRSWRAISSACAIAGSTSG